MQSFSYGIGNRRRLPFGKRAPLPTALGSYKHVTLSEVPGEPNVVKFRIALTGHC